MLFKSFAIWLALCGSLAAQTIGGLSTIPPLTEGRFPVTGLEVPGGSIDELSRWAQKLVVSVDGPAGSEATIEVDIGLVKRSPTLYFAGDKSGIYVLCLVDTGSKTPKILTKRVQVGEVVPPSPNPTPPGPGPGPTNPDTPIPSPTTKKIVQATFVYEKSKHQVPGQVAATLRELSLSSGFFGSAVDQDIKNGDGETPANYAKAIELAKADGLPCLVIEYSDGTARVVKSVATGDDIRKAVTL